MYSVAKQKVFVASKSINNCLLAEDDYKCTIETFHVFVIANFAVMLIYAT